MMLGTRAGGYCNGTDIVIDGGWHLVSLRKTVTMWRSRSERVGTRHLSSCWYGTVDAGHSPSCAFAILEHTGCDAALYVPCSGQNPSPGENTQLSRGEHTCKKSVRCCTLAGMP
jgi:hypothetical protein